MTASCDEFVDLLRDSNLLTKEQYSHLTRELVPAVRDPEKLAEHLIKLGWVTRYQIQRLNSERWRELFLGDYFLWDLIGEGGMGEVFRARRILDRQEVAMKVISPDKMSDEIALKRFHREARLASKLNHPNVVKLIETGKDGNRHYIVMEYVDGMDLHYIIENEGSLSVPIACEYIRQIATALQHAHSQKMVHRDIKPSNILIGNRTAKDPGVAKLLDLGLARSVKIEKKESKYREPVASEASSHSSNPSGHTALTRFGAVIGTADYMSPEQAVDSSAVDHRADIYSLGCTLYYLLTGKPVFEDGSPIEKLLKHQMDDPVNIRQLRHDVPKELGRHIHRSMAKRPENRFQSCADLARVLEPFCVSVATADNSLETSEHLAVKTAIMPHPLTATTEGIPLAELVSSENSPPGASGGSKALVYVISLSILALLALAGVMFLGK
ncbi:serine/threonine protein kinase [Telmatocola sphagniphila]|uniref:Serine/threonine protein kinase n=1 Tax=Telmatocola sphagniphila TaxID=1123043 RepID=A0A8E6B887_9BACT|nr:serine/threonine-protein kinase [Telmatocola sphagniphila]QVL33703.1 serine/threonine protein kinase [Telmatocola sphagniphila]